MKNLKEKSDQDTFATFRARTFLGHDFEFFHNDARGKSVKLGVTPEGALFPALSSLFEILPEDGTCLDVGANIGLHSAFFSQFFAMTYSFEPNPYVFEVLKNNIERNGLSVQPVNVGLGDEDARLDFHIHKTNMGQSTFSNEIAVRSHFIPIEASVVRGDTFLELKGVKNVSYIKIDVEGFEARVISGLEKTIAACTPLMCIEWNNDITRREFFERRLFSTQLVDYLPFGFWQERWSEFVQENDYEMVVLLPRELVPAFIEKVRNRIY